MNELRKKEGRGKFLTTLLLFALLLLISNILHFLMEDIRHLHNMPLLYVMEQIIIPPLYIAVYVGILRWRKVAVYTSFLLPLVQIVFINTLLIPKSTSVLTLLSITGGVVFVSFGLSLWFWAFKRKWHLFT